jgi:hypothetical protein
VAQVQKLLDAGKSVFVLLPGAKGRAIGTQMGDDHSWLNVQYKGWKDPKTRSRSRLTVNLKADDDESLKLSPGSQFTDNKDRPFDYTLTGSANTSGRGLGEGWFSKAEPGVDDAGKELMKQDRQAHPDMDDYSWQIGWIYAEGDKDVKAAYSDAYYDNPTIPSPPEPRSFKLGFDARKNQGVAEAAVNDINFGHTVGKGSWIVYDPETKQIKKRFKTHTAGKSYAKVHGLGFASSEFYFDRVKGKEVAESDSGDYDYPYTMSARDKGRYDAMTGREYNNPYSAFGTQEDHKNAIEYSAAYDSVNDEGVAEEETDYSKRRQRERDIDAGKPVEPEDEDDGETDYSRRRAQQKKELELGEAPVAMPPPRPPAIVRSAPAVPSKPIAPRAAPTSKKSDDTVVNPTTQPWYQGWLSNATKPTPSDDKKDDKKKDVKESYWTKLQAERSTKLNSLVNELKESLK